MNAAEAHRELIVLGLEVAFVLGLGLVAQASPGWGAPAVVLILLLWGGYLIRHSDQLAGLFGETAVGGGGSAGSFTP